MNVHKSLFKETISGTEAYDILLLFCVLTDKRYLLRVDR